MEDQPWGSSKLRRRTCAFLDSKVQSEDDDLQLEVGKSMYCGQAPSPKSMPGAVLEACEPDRLEFQMFVS